MQPRQHALPHLLPVLDKRTRQSTIKNNIEKICVLPQPFRFRCKVTEYAKGRRVCADNVVGGSHDSQRIRFLLLHHATNCLFNGRINGAQLRLREARRKGGCPQNFILVSQRNIKGAHQTKHHILARTGAT
jgi:hypothetical protein